ncbi:GNAT family N-acetyltransferase [Thiocystis violacea]|uniref:GNAT family N-acetyltransferase n=1 Tax=Thiocystis violacea TaxID=13725 RepID=UPI001908318C|nr:GNAT family N-acetyltransferase [Thiocystis violacea]
MDIRILDREEAATIDPVAWDRLARTSGTPNPFYERWHLLPALGHLDRRDPVFVVVLSEAGRLVGLFPFCLRKKAGMLRYLTLWEFRDCRICDVLREPGVELGSVFQDLMDRFRAPIMLLPAHASAGLGLGMASSYCRLRLTRRAVTRFVGWDDYRQRLPRRDRLENARVLRRLLDREGVEYVTSSRELVRHWLPLYSDLERQGWKAREGRVISGDDARMRYFQEAMTQGELEGKVEFQALLKGDEALAISFRFRTRNNAYEIKTTYNEKYRHLYPGVALELLNVGDALNGGYALVDSCSEKNRVVERVWPDTITMYRTVVFKGSLLGALARLVYGSFKRFVTRHDPGAFVCHRSTRAAPPSGRR